MPFDIAYGAPITAERAAQVVAAAVAEAKKSPRNWKLAISVVDTNGDLVYFYQMDQTQIASVSVSLGKARTAARYRRPSEIFFNQMQTQAGAFYATLGDPPPVASPGGFPLIEGGKVIGAIGCSGTTGAQEAVACKAGADSPNDILTIHRGNPPCRRQPQRPAAAARRHGAPRCAYASRHVAERHQFL
jgi:glc operon protein GlcG